MLFANNKCTKICGKLTLIYCSGSCLAICEAALRSRSPLVGGCTAAGSKSRFNRRQWLQESKAGQRVARGDATGSCVGCACPEEEPGLPGSIPEWRWGSQQWELVVRWGSLPLSAGDECSTCGTWGFLLAFVEMEILQEASLNMT